jgi:DNA-binding phage protein
MRQQIKVAELPEFDAAHHLNGEAAIAAFLSEVLKADDAALLVSALTDILRARLLAATQR